MKILICDGKTDVAVISSLCKDAGIEDLIIESCDGRGNLERYIRDLPIRPEFARGEVESLAVLIDAELDANTSWQKVQNAIQQGFSIKLEGSGITHLGKPRIIAAVIPEGENCGMIEDLCLKAVSDQPEYLCMTQYFECLSSNTEVKDYPSKAKFRAWMASKPDFDLYLGLAATKGYIPWESPVFTSILALLRQL